MVFRWRRGWLISDFGDLTAARPPVLSITIALLTAFWTLIAPLHASGQNARPTAPQVRYELRLNPQRERHYTVRISIPRPNTPNAEFAIPAWTPGYYQILHFESGIDRVQAMDETGRMLPVAHGSPRSWSVATAGSSGKTVSLQYDVAGSDKGLGFFGSMLDNRHHTGFINGASAFMYSAGLEHVPVGLTIDIPTGWQCATPLTSEAQSGYSAATYDDLIDSPIQIGDFDTFKFEAQGIPCRCVITGERRANPGRVASILSKIASEAIGVFKSAPFDRYVFFYHIGEAGFIGGLEHHNSTVIHLEDPIGDGDDDEFVTTSAHEFFHAWNVKRLRPQGLGPFDYTRATRTPSLWWAEGVTDYYADLLPVRAGLRSYDWYLRQIVERIRQLDSVSARSRVTLVQASNQAWEGNSEGFAGLSYYLKGSLVGFYLDLRLRNGTAGKCSLDDVMRTLYEEYGIPDIGYPESAIAAAITNASGLNLLQDYNKYVGGTDDIAWEDVLPQAGFLLARQADGYVGASFVPNPPEDEFDESDETDRAAIVQRVEPGYPAAKMDLRPGDRLVAIDGKAVTYGFAGAIVRSLPAAVPVRFIVTRHGRTLELVGEAGTQYSHHALSFVPITNQTPQMRATLKDLFASRAAGTPHN